MGWLSIMRICQNFTFQLIGIFVTKKISNIPKFISDGSVP